MGALDEILALEQGVKDAETAILTKKTGVLAVKKAISDSKEGVRVCSEAVAIAHAELLKLMQADTVSLFEYQRVRGLSNEAEDLLFRHRMELVKKNQKLGTLNKEIEKLEENKKLTESQMNMYGLVKPFQRPMEEDHVED